MDSTVAKTFQCSIVTPTAAVFDGAVTYATFPAWDGQYGMLPGLAPLLGRLAVGPLRLDLPDGGSRWFLLDGGFAQVQNDVLTLLTEDAMAAESIDLAEAQAEVAAAEARTPADGDDRDRIQHDRERAQARLALARRVSR